VRWSQRERQDQITGMSFGFIPKLFIWEAVEVFKAKNDRLETERGWSH
jgi:hypothetical protein